MAWRAFHDEVDQLGSKFKPDLVILAELSWSQILGVIRHWNVPIIYDAHNVEVDRFHEMVKAQHGSEKTLRRAREAAEAESAITSAASQIWTCSEIDRDRMADTYRVKQPIVIPNGVDLSFYCRDTQGPTHPDPTLPSFKFLYTGDFSYPPNAAAADRICLQLLPRLRQKLGHIRLYLAGNNPTASMLRYAASDGDIIVTGRIPDIRPYLKNSDCMLVPLDHGGGTRLKLLEAFAAGCPVVSTPKGAEGLAVASGTHLMIATTDSEIVERAVEVCSRREKANALIENARSLIESTYDWPVIHQQIEQAVQRLIPPENPGAPLDPDVLSLRQ